MFKKISLLFLFLLPLIVIALDCSECGKRIRGKYVKSNDAVFCSRKCFLKTVPHCDGCGEPCEKQVVSLLDKTFCSRECLLKTIKCRSCRKGAENVVVTNSPYGEKIILCRQCHRQKKCYFCMMPGEITLNDGRRICRSCRKTAVVNHKDIRRIFNLVRRDMGRWFGYDQKHRIELLIVSPGELEKISASVYMPEESNRLALMRYERKTIEKRLPDGRIKKEFGGERCRIYIVDTVPRALLTDAFAHELTHDFLRHNVGTVNELSDEEGFCELIASLYNEKSGNRRVNRGKELKKDPVYGGGYKKMYSRYLKSGKNWRKILKTIKAVPFK